jgi:hypothetical protein
MIRNRPTAAGVGGRVGANRAIFFFLVWATMANTASAEPVVQWHEAAQLLLVPESPPGPIGARLEADARRCQTTSPADVDGCRIRGLLGHAYQGDPAAARAAVALYDDTGTVAGLLPEQDFDGAYRGTLHLVPRLPVHAHRRHLEMAASALRDFDSFFAELERRSGRKVAFRWRPLGLRFFESVKRRTPSAVATGWTISHNVNGSLFTSATRTRETYVHEVFHLNDQARGWWSLQALSDVYRRIVARCGTAIACLKPFAPDDIIVRGRGGTYYAFMPDNGVTEYAADVAKRWVVEHHGALAGKPPKTPWRCQTPENMEAWHAVADAFFGGIDLLPPCR